MRIEVNLRLKSCAETGRSSFQIDLDAASCIGELLSILNIPKDTPTILLLNGTQAQHDQLLKDGDILSVIAPVCGG